MSHFSKPFERHSKYDLDIDRVDYHDYNSSSVNPEIVINDDVDLDRLVIEYREGQGLSSGSDSEEKPRLYHGGIPIEDLNSRNKRSGLPSTCDMVMASSLPLNPRNPFPEIGTAVLPSANIEHGSSTSSNLSNMLHLPHPRILTVQNGSHSIPGSRSHSPVTHRKDMGSRQNGHMFKEDLSWRPNGLSQLLLTVYNTDETSKTLSVHSNMSVLDLCHLLVLKNHVIEDKNWVLVEHIDKFNIDRALEDHEVVSDVFHTWKNESEANKFYFRKDFKKYDFFLNPAQYFPALIESLSDDVLAVRDNVIVEHKKTVLLQNLLCSTERLPDVQGMVHIRDCGKKSFKKVFCILRASGLYYSTKSSSKEPKHLTAFSVISDINIYTTCSHTKKSFHAPTDFCIVLKPCNKEVHDAKEMKFLCVEDEKSRMIWLAGLRLIKYGKQLSDNYKTIVRRLDKLKGKSEDKSSMNKNSGSQERVAMDFSGNQGRVIDDPNEAMGVAIEEGQSWRKKAVLRPGTSPLGYSKLDPVPTNRHGFLSLNPGLGSGLSSGIHMTQPWFHSGLTREESTMLIVQNGLVDGAFLIRESHKTQDSFVLSLSHNQKVKHYQIIQVEFENSTYLSMDDGTTKFADLLQMVDFYQVNAGGLPCRLTNHVTNLV